jgi:hypothetical protein
MEIFFLNNSFFRGQGAPWEVKGHKGAPWEVKGHKGAPWWQKGAVPF